MSYSRKIKIPHGSKGSGKHVPVTIVEIDADGNEVPGTEEHAIMKPDGSIGHERFDTPGAARAECDRRNASEPT